MTTAYLIHHQPPTTNHNNLIAGWKKHFWKKNTIFWGLHQGTQVTASPWKLPDARQFMVCDAPGGESQCWKLVGFSWLSEHQKHFFVKKTSWKKRSDLRRSLFLTCTGWFKLTQLDSPSWRSPTNFWVRVMEFHSPRKLQGAGKTIVARNLARKNRCNNRWLPKEHLLAYLKMVGKPLQKWHPKKKNPTPYNIYTFSTGHWVYILPVKRAPAGRVKQLGTFHPMILEKRAAHFVCT